MKYDRLPFTLAIVAASCLALGVTSTAAAQGRGGGGPPGGGGMGGPQFPGSGGPGPGGPQFPGNGPAQGGPGQGGPGIGQPRPQRGPGPDARSGFQLGPPEQRWWDDRSFIKSLKLRPEQRAKMDAIFDQNRAALQARLAGAQQADAQMEQLSRSPTPDEAALFAQIDRVAQAHAELDKATTHMLLQMRREMDPDQIKRLEKETARSAE